MQSNETSSKKINKLNLALSVAIAFASWLYVVYSINPVSYTHLDVYKRQEYPSIYQNNWKKIKWETS